MATPGAGKLNPYSARPWTWRPYRDGRWLEPNLEFDPGWRAAFFVETYLRHTKGRWRGKPFQLFPFQLAAVLEMFGRVDAEGLRRVRTAYLEFARKSGKSELAAAVALKLLFADGEAGAEIYGAAYDREQASLVYSVAADMVELSDALSAKADVRRSTKRIIAKETSGVYVAIPADAAGSHGFNAHGIVFDEVHTQRTRDLWDVLNTSQGTREQPLTFAITTAGTDRTSIAWELHDYALKVQNKVVTDRSWYADIRNVADDADWRDRKLWAYANPGLGNRKQIQAGKAFRSVEEMERMAKEAEFRPALQTTFRNLYLNQWTASRSQWLDMRAWELAGSELFSESSLVGKQCYGGLDLSSTRDLSAWVLCFPDEGALRWLWRCWIPEAWVENHQTHPLAEWARQGFITVTPGDVIDYDAIERQITQDAEKFRVLEVGFDPWQATGLVTRLAERGLTVAKVPQGMATLTAPTKEIERLVAAGLFRHNGHPVARWCADNVVLRITGDQQRPDKEKASDKIDLIAAAVNAVERLLAAEPVGDVYAWRA